MQTLQVVRRPELLEGVLRHQGDHRVRGDTHVERGEPGVESHRSALGHDLPDAVHGALVLQLPRHRVRSLLLHLRLNEVERQAEEGREESGNAGGTENQRNAVTPCDSSRSLEEALNASMPKLPM